MSNLAIKVECVSKKYRIRRGFSSNQTSLKAILNAPFNWLSNNNYKHTHLQQSGIIWALKDISFDITHGESVGVIGRNGAGKTTLLKIISRITRPSQGKITLYYRPNSLIGIGAGFNPALSGKENVYLNGSFLGMKLSEIEQKYDEIVAFSEVEKFINTPVKYYSSGMYMRLAFSIAVHLTPEILILDEVFAVGDAGFQHKSKEKMKELLGGGATIILVSHSNKTIRDICKRTIWLDKGVIKMDGPSAEVGEEYGKFIKEEN